MTQAAALSSYGPFVAPGTSGNLLTSNGTAWTSAAPGVTASASTAATTQYVVGVPAAGSSQTPIVSTTSAVSFLPSTGAMTAVSFSASSDERLKINWQALPSGFLEGLAQVKHGIFDRVDTGNTQVGVGAQSLQAVLAEAVAQLENGYLAVDYGAAALVACIQLAQRVIELEKKLEGR